MEYYSHKKISDYVTLILTCTGENLFLIEGKKSALLVDTGCGIGNLKEYVDRITDLPYEVFCTHGHIDHAGGAGFFDRVYMSHKDLEVEKDFCTVEGRKRYASFVFGDAVSEIPEEYMDPPKQEHFIDIEEGYVFDLGDLELRTILVPGHTPGMMCLLIEKERRLLAGDAFNQRTFVFMKEATTISEYLESLRRLKKYDDRYDEIYLSHREVLQPRSVLDDCIECCEQILAGKASEEHAEFWGVTYYLAVETDGMYRTDGKLGNVCFNPDKI
jgi:glyoxylase-like metal-dependent hydrolase (beta-lactamase superfamily II)